MKRMHRLLLVGAALASAMAVVVVLSSIGAASTGPLTSILEWTGAAVGSLERGMRERISGSAGRKDALAWFEADRSSADRLRRPEKVLLGAWDDQLPETLAGVVALERSIETTFPLVQVYAAWGDKPDQRFPAELVTTIADLGSVPIITWEPWLTDFENVRHPELPLRDQRERHGLAAVAGGAYDFYIDEWATAAARFGRPLFLRFAHEMNDPYRYPWGPQNNTRDEFASAWQHVRQRFQLAGANNVIWVWAPHIAVPGWKEYYPGDSAVDWIATGVLNYGVIGVQWSEWWTFADIFARRYPDMAAFNKPIMIAEFGSLAVGGDRDAWYREALTHLPQRFPRVHAVVFFHTTRDQTVTQQALDWSLVAEPDITRTIAEAIAAWAPRNR